MKIHKPELTKTPTSVVLAAQIETEGVFPDVPNEIWYELPLSFAETISIKINPFVILLTPFAMFHGEDIEIDDVMSSRLHYGLNEYQRIFSYFHPELFSKIKIKTKGFEDVVFSETKSGSALAFSGGVDSFYTLWNHLPKNQPDENYKISHAFFIHGMDIPLSDSKSYKDRADAYQKVIEGHGVNFVPVRTNAKRFMGEMDFTWASNTLVIGTGHLFENLVCNTFYSEDNTPDYPPPLSTQRYLVPLLSTETVSATCFGGTVSKLQRLEVLSKWPETYSLLRTCWEKPDGINNCCRCRKCALQMSALDMLGTLDKFTSFPLPIDKKLFRKHTYNQEGFLMFPRDWIRFAKKCNRRDWVWHYRYILFISKFKILFYSMLPFSKEVAANTDPIPLFYMYRISAWLKSRSILYTSLLRNIKQIS